MNQPTVVLDERELRACLDRAEYDRATTLTLERYGPELIGFLRSRFRGDSGVAREAFAWLAEDVWRGMRNFRGDSSFRTWTYAIARNVVRRFADRELRLRMLAVPLSQVSRASALSVSFPSVDDIDARAERIRALLEDDEQILLTLRVDKNMDWKDIAEIMLFEGDASSPEADPDAIKREAARLRKRFQLLKEKLRGLVAEAT